MRRQNASAEPTSDELLALGDLLDGIDFAKHWDQTTPVEAEYSGERLSNTIVLPPSLMKRARAKARKLGKTTDAVIRDCVRTGLAAR